MASAVINWTPGGGGNVQSQQIQYRMAGTTSWTSAVTGLGPTVNTYTVTGLSDNTIYEFRVVSICSIGGPIYSSILTDIKWYCPVITLTPTHNTITYSFSNLGGSISGYTVELLNNAQDTVIQTKTTISGVFDSGSITPLTTYYVRLTLTASSYSHVCSDVSTATTAAPTCPIPTITSASIS